MRSLPEIKKMNDPPKPRKTKAQLEEELDEIKEALKALWDADHRLRKLVYKS